MNSEGSPHGYAQPKSKPIVPTPRSPPVRARRRVKPSRRRMPSGMASWPRRWSSRGKIPGSSSSTASRCWRNWPRWGRWSRCWPSGSSACPGGCAGPNGLQAAAFDKIEDQHEPPEPTLPPEVASKMLAVLAESNWHPPAPAVTPSAGRRWAVQDFNQERVLDRLLVYERRIEHSLYRTMAELRKLRKEGGIASVKSEVSSVVPASHLPLETSGEPPESSAPNGDGDEACETNPISAGVSSLKSEVSSVLPTSTCHLKLRISRLKAAVRANRAKRTQFGSLIRRRRTLPRSRGRPACTQIPPMK